MTTPPIDSARLGGSWRVAFITARIETSSGPRIWSMLLQTAISLAVTIALWRALYAGTTTVAGVTHDQAITYAVLAALLTYLQVGRFSRRRSMDSVTQHVYNGTIVYWFLRPVSPSRYHLQRAVGDTGYALIWAATGYFICRALGVVDGPVTLLVGLVTVVSLALGQAIAYLISLILDQLCFWTIVNDQILAMVAFVQTMLSGGFVPLWFFPAWFQTASLLLPFQAVINVPMSVYVGRIHGAQVLAALGLQLFWLLILALVSRVLWRAAASRVQAQGG